MLLILCVCGDELLCTMLWALWSTVQGRAAADPTPPSRSNGCMVCKSRGLFASSRKQLIALSNTCAERLILFFSVEQKHRQQFQQG